MTEFIQVYTTIDSREKAEAIATALVESRLAACVQVSGPVTSVYRWEGAVQSSKEWQCSAKTKASLFPQVESTIRKLHSYDCPEIIATAIDDGAKDYLDWLHESN